MKQFILVICSLYIYSAPRAQDDRYIFPEYDIDSLKNELKSTNNDTQKLVLLNQLRANYFFIPATLNLDSSLLYSEQMVEQARQLDYQIDVAYSLDCVGDVMSYLHKQNTLKKFFEGIKIAENPAIEKKVMPRKYLERMVYFMTDFNSILINNQWEPSFFRRRILASLYGDLGHAYGNIMLNEQRQRYYLSKAFEMYGDQKDTSGLAFVLSNISDFFVLTGQLDSGLHYAQKFYALTRTEKERKSVFGYLLTLRGEIEFKNGNDRLALILIRHAVNQNYFKEMGELTFFTRFPHYTLSKILLKIGQQDSALYYARQAYGYALKTTFPVDVIAASSLLADIYSRSGEKDSAITYFQISQNLSEKINNANKLRNLQSQDFEEEQRQQELETSKIAFRNQVKLYVLFGGLGALLLIAIILYRNNRQRKKSNILLQQKNMEVERSLSNLKTTQAQLIQSEKMASLGELTAGIAHEIQNPLNFVNNFSEVNKDLLREMDVEIEKGNFVEARQIAKSVVDNEDKILQHGKRADAIVKGMLQHSRSASGLKERSDINALADEYLRLVYHGMRAKDSSFNAELKTDFDPSIGKVNIVPSEIGRVLLNLYNNAFYSVHEKKKSTGDGYIPIVTVSTERVDGRLQISVKDNGNGIPEKIRDKIFQPFFTTKPTGEGTGLGLSLAYDIVTKGHGGELILNSAEEGGSEFIVILKNT